MSKKWLLLLGLALAGAASSACAAAAGPTTAVDQGVPPAAEKAVRQAVAAISAKVEIDAIAPAPMPGFYQVIAEGQMLYVSADGKYIFNGDLLDPARKENLSDTAWAKFRKTALAGVPASARIVFAPAHPRYTVSVFTDVNCDFCRALHEQIAAFNKAGIAVEYLAWPREGMTNPSGQPTPTYTEMVSVWCASDPKAAFSAAMDGHAPKPASCANPVAKELELGLRLGVDGTPTIIAPDGSKLDGYLTASQLLETLQQGS